MVPSSGSMTQRLCSSAPATAVPVFLLQEEALAWARGLPVAIKQSRLASAVLLLLMAKLVGLARGRRHLEWRQNEVVKDSVLAA